MGSARYPRYLAAAVEDFAAAVQAVADAVDLAGFAAVAVALWHLQAQSLV